MARIAGINLPKNKRVEIGLTYIMGIGVSRAKKMVDKLNIDSNLKIHELTEAQINQLREEVSQYKVEGDLRRDNQDNIKRLIRIQCYRGGRHVKKLPVRGQNTQTNARTRKGKKKQVANKKK
jgi:small subunit ribosomal protein S13